jgi:hypothetical protein
VREAKRTDKTRRASLNGAAHDDAPAERPGPLVTINANDLYTLSGARTALRLSRTTFRREIRLGRLRISSRAGRRWLLGEWLLEWLRGGELPRKQNGHAEK